MLGGVPRPSCDHALFIYLFTAWCGREGDGGGGGGGGGEGVACLICGLSYW